MTKPAKYRVRNWAQFQHYKDRNPAWIKLHFALLASEDWVTLDDASRLLAIVCMLVASRNDGCVPNNPGYLKRVGYLDQEPNLAPLISCGFLEIPLADASEPYQPQADARPEERRGYRSREDKITVSNETDAEAAPTVVEFPDARTTLFRDGLAAISAMTGKPASACRSLLGKWLKQANDDAAVVMATIRRAATNRVAEPVAWIERSLKPHDPDDAIYRGVM